MAREKRAWNPKFIKYMEMIINHPNYEGLPIIKKADGSYAWIAPAESEVGAKRKTWCESKAIELGIEVKPGVYADVMLAIHPTKWKVCQTCGNEMSLYYHYPNTNFVNSINKEFETSFNECDHISDIWKRLCNDYGISENVIATFLIKKGGLDLNPIKATKDEIIKALEFACRKGGKKCLGPGAMSNFPDRYDGFHTYNRCCRSSQDKGRSKDNLKSYTKDRRAYEYWSDGNIHAANQFMCSKFFSGVSADHIGPISLGFVHDPRYLQPMTGSDNSTKRDRLLIEDVIKIIETEQRTQVYPISWYSKEIWEYIKANYHNNLNKVAVEYRDALKQNMTNYMFILYNIMDKCSDSGKSFLIEVFLKPNYDYFDYSYTFNEKGEILSKDKRHITGRNINEKERYNRIAIESVYDYNDKDNRHTNPDLTKTEQDTLDYICLMINQHKDVSMIKNQIIKLVNTIEERLISYL